MVGNTVGQYRIVGRIGVGGMGVVYSAEHVLLGRSAAVKVLLPEVSSSHEMSGRFFNEARAAAAIQHPGIVEIYDFGRHSDGSAYIVMEHLRGESLAQRLARGRMAPAVVALIARQVASALTAAHGRGIVHRDLKPDNIFLVPDTEVIGGERIKLLDFGIAKLDRDGEQHRTRTGVVMGTPTYMAPEQCKGLAVDHRADLYALGCILFELCTGRPPFTGVGDGDVLASHIHVPPPGVSSLVGGIPAALETVIERLLVKERDRRLQSAEQVVQAMHALLSSEFSSDLLAQILAQPHHRTTLSASASMVLPRSVTRHRGAWLTGIALVAGAAIAMGAIIAGTMSSIREPSLASAAASTPVPPSTMANHHPATPQSDLVVEAAQPGSRNGENADLPRATTSSLDTARSPAVVGPRAPLTPSRPHVLPRGVIPLSDEAVRKDPQTMPASPPADPITADQIAEQYAAVGRQLKAFDQDRVSAATSDLWPRYLSIRINDAIANADRRPPVSDLLRQLHDQIAERSR